MFVSHRSSRREAIRSIPFVVALQRIEQENGRMLQTQIRLLKEACTELPVERREAVVEEKSQLVEAAFARFLAWLAGA
jgi:hypothetical protein